MYLEHFGLRELPFSLTPDTSFFFNYAGHQDALNTLLIALRSGEGFIKVTGEVGTGKTLLCRKLLDSLGTRFVTAYIPNPFLTPTALRLALADELGVQCARNLGQHRLLKLITQTLIELHAAGKRVVLCLDEAQALPDDSLEALRLLTNLETEKHKLLQVVLFGQPELDRRLEQPALRQLKQRITFSCRLEPVERGWLDAYIEHRLRVAGYAGDTLFEPRALDAVYRASRGIPRPINILCHKALMSAYGRGIQRVQRSDARLAVMDTEGTQAPRALNALRLILGALGLAMVLAAGIGIYVVWGVTL